MTKQNKKTIKTSKTIKTKQAPKGQAPKKDKAPLDFKTALKSNDLATALKMTKAQRRAYLQKVFAPDTLQRIQDLANRMGQGGKAYDIRASFPCKSDLAKIDTIKAFEGKARQNITPRQITALLIAYLAGDGQGFTRIFENGLFLENGALKDLLTGGLIEDLGGQGIDQNFCFTKKPLWVFQDKDFQGLCKGLQGQI